MAQALNTGSEPLEQSPAGRVMDEAMRLAIEERSPYPERCLFIDAEGPHLGREICRAVDDDMAVVLVSRDGSVRVLRPEPLRLADEDATRPQPPA